MNKVLMIGLENIVFNDLKSRLIEKQYDVLVSDFAYGKIEKSIKSSMPNLIVIIQNSEGGIQSSTLRLIRSDFKEIPVIIICDENDKFNVTLKPPQFNIMYRPVSSNEFLIKVDKLIKDEDDIYINSYGDLPYAVSEKKDASSFDIANEEEGGSYQDDIIIINKDSEDPDEKEDDTIVLGGPLPDMRILAVDDNPQIVRSIKMILHDEYEIVLATSGEKALEILETNNIDLILLDYEMPGMSGPEVLTEIKNNPKTKRIPVIFLTGVSDTQRIMKAVELKPAAYLLKPIDAKVMKDTIFNVLWKFGK